ncbi:TLC domain-containing protein [Emericellopsis atlantica]|uniref:TLC domain-containing protein n=1 Tax=Emericellopsis atlantica TaxID=2614577 RepID=A0A9P8CNT5_9HYPO|nr:TLC domain-containing protein [Emericellopsis atlantica]KAG9253843.1 TLC domain-containing protein [Emericellopsis atlantica]
MSEPFPLLNTSADALRNFEEVSNTTATDAGTNNVQKRRPRKSSALGTMDIRAGDTGAALATSKAAFDAGDHSSVSGGSNGPGLKKRSVRRRRGFFGRARHIMIKHTFVLPALIALAMLAAYAVRPNESNPMHRFIFLSYKEPGNLDANGNVQYGKGPWDIAFVAFYTVVLSFTREFVMQEMIKPLARRAGLRSKGKLARFMEQGYTAFYFFFLGPLGMYVMSRTPVWYFNTRGMYEDFPHRHHDAFTKFYYLFQAAYWAQQAIVLVLGMEKPRKDFKELIAHHIVSLALIGLSYRFHFTYIGIAVYTTHDISDFFLATSKTLNYLDHPITDKFYAFFICVWIYMRHYINLKIIWSLFTEFRTVGPFELNWETEQYKCLLSQVITTSLLTSLQALNIFWLYYILRIAYRALFKNELKDDRSDDEEEEP